MERINYLRADMQRLLNKYGLRAKGINAGVEVENRRLVLKGSFEAATDDVRWGV